MIWFDTHCHLQDEAYNDDFAAVLKRAFEAGVTRIMLATSTVEDSEIAAKLAARHIGVFASIGVHPHDSKTWDQDSAARLAKLTELRHTDGSPVVVAVGEIGLDYYYDHSPRDVQKKIYRRQIELAHELDLPIIIHEREAFADSYAILQQAAADGLLADQPGVCHCFSGSWESAQLMMKLGFMLGFDGPVTFKNARKAPEIVSRMPLEYMVLETDSPYLTPVPYRGKRNESAYIPLIGAKVAEFRDCEISEVAKQTTANGIRLYRLEDYQDSVLKF